MIHHHFFRNYFRWGALILLAALVVAGVGGWPQLFGHTANEIQPIVLEKTLSCVGTSCHLDCDPGYAAFSGSCTSSSPTPRWNLFGVSSDKRGWDCVDGAANHTTALSINLTCVKTSFDSTSTSFCGDYAIDSPEVCDGPNIKDIDCEDYTLNSGTQLCNGSIGACATTCDGVNISKCEYCDVGDCTVPGEIKCANGTCAQFCDSDSGGPLGGSGNTLDDASTQSNWYYPPGPPLPPSIPGPGPGAGFCGDGVPGNSAGEECDTGGDLSVGVASCGMQCMQCPPGTGPFVMFYGTCDGSCKCVDPQCGANPAQACVDPGSGPGSDPGSGFGTVNP